jgi:hypothetical protein
LLRALEADQRFPIKLFPANFAVAAPISSREMDAAIAGLPRGLLEVRDATTLLHIN